MNTNDSTSETAIDRNLGLDRYEGNQKIYANVLETFKRNNKDILKELSGAINANNNKLAYRIAHSLRGAAGTLGATRLADAAFSVEHFLADKDKGCCFNEGETFKMQMSVLESAYTAVYDELELLVKDKEPDCSSYIMNREKTLELIGKLTPFLEVGDAKSVEYLDEIHDSFLSAAEEFKLFTTQMESYDFEQALETMNRIRQFMGA